MATGLKFIKVEIDPDNGSNFSVTGTAQLLSVPYALYAGNATAGINGKSAYEIWLDAGNYGNVTDYLNSLIGPQGIAGVGTEGQPGAKGNKGADGKDGQSAYQVWLKNGHQVQK